MIIEFDKKGCYYLMCNFLAAGRNHHKDFKKKILELKEEKIIKAA